MTREELDALYRCRAISHKEWTEGRANIFMQRAASPCPGPSLRVKVRRFCRAFLDLDNMTALLLALAFTSFGFLLCALYMNYK